MAGAYAWQKTYEAVLALAATDAPLRRRLELALMAFAACPASDVPDALRSRFSQLWSAMELAQGGIVASVHAMDDRGVHRTIQAILSFYEHLAREEHATRAADDATAVE